MRLLGAEPVAGEQTRAAMVYRGAYDAGRADLVVRPSPRGVADFVFFARPPERSRVRHAASIAGAAGALVLDHGEVVVRAASGPARLRLRRPWLVDRRGERQWARVEVERCGGEGNGVVRCLLAVSWRVEASRYPIVLDPAWEEAGDVGDGVGGRPWMYPRLSALSNGRVLLGGCGERQWQIFEPPNGWTEVDDGPQETDGHAQTTLPGGKVLVTGGRRCVNDGDPEAPPTNLARVFDPSASSPDKTGTTGNDMKAARSGHAAVFLPEHNRVLVVGGTGGGPGFERYDVDAGTWSEGGESCPEFVSNVQAVLLEDASVLAVGGSGDTVCHVAKYSPVGNEWTVVDPKDSEGKSLLPNSGFFSLTALGDGGALLFGGEFQGSDIAALYLPKDDDWDSLTPGPLTAGRMCHATVLLPSGRVPITGGVVGGDSGNGVDVFDPSVKQFWSTSPMNHARRAHAAIALADGPSKGQALVAGGQTGLGPEDDVGVTKGERYACPTGIVSNDTCCDEPCNGLCESCDEPGHVGRCVALDGGLPGDGGMCSLPPEPGCNEMVCNGRKRDACVYAATEPGCRPSCTRVDDCAPGMVCMPEGVCVRAPSVTGGWGCVCTTVSGRGQGGWPAALLAGAVAMSAAARRRRVAQRPCPRWWRAIGAVLVLLLGGRAMAAPATNDPEAQPAPSGAAPVLDGRVPLAAGFPPAELAGIGAAASWYVALVAFQRPIVTGLLGGTDARGCERCRLGAPGQLDRDVSEALYRGPDAAPLFGRFPDRLGMAIGPAVAGLFYLEDALLLWSTGRGVTGNRHADHELVALVEAFALAMAVNQTVKVSTGRLRPYYELGRSPSLPPPPDTNLSFFSGHATSAFTLAAFVSRDLGDWLAVRPLARAAPAARILVGRVVPAVALYGAASLVAVSRIVDQAHYLTDVALGAAVGSLVGNLVYALHFDTAGAPRRLGASAATARLHPLPGGVALAGEY